MSGFKFESYLDKVKKEIIAGNKKVLRKAGAVVLNEARKILNNTTDDALPKRVTGNLKKGLKMKVTGYSAKVGNTAPHAWLVEHGHDVIRDGKKVGTAKPHPFLAPAFENATDRVREILTEKRD